ncbi:hypothetical protein DFH09DRAFT_1067619 [Mycena vulgaris]|nr:hypothetical protein DFH09DRAFT_1067619 [Mycena vulgaris]
MSVAATPLQWTYPTHLSASSISLYTTTSSSTQWGPGALAGKAILAMGKAVVRGADYILISRRVATIKAAMPCLDGQSRSLEMMFDDLLELSRPDLYPDAVRIQAMQIILVQIATEQTHHLRRSISKWEIEYADLVALLSEIIGDCFIFEARLENSMLPEDFFDEKLVDAYLTALPKESHPSSPCIGFMAEVAQLNGVTFRAVPRRQVLGNASLGFWSTAKGELNMTKPWNPNAIMHSASSQRRPLSSYAFCGLDTVGIICANERPNSLPPTAARHHSSTNVAVCGAPLAGDSCRKHAKGFAAVHTSGLLECTLTLGGDVDSETVHHFSRLSYRKMVVTITQMIRELIAQSCVDQYVLIYT